MTRLPSYTNNIELKPPITPQCSSSQKAIEEDQATPNGETLKDKIKKKITQIFKISTPDLSGEPDIISPEEYKLLIFKISTPASKEDALLAKLLFESLAKKINENTLISITDLEEIAERYEEMKKTLEQLFEFEKGTEEQSLSPQLNKLKTQLSHDLESYTLNSLSDLKLYANTLAKKIQDFKQIQNLQEQIYGKLKNLQTQIQTCLHLDLNSNINSLEEFIDLTDLVSRLNTIIQSINKNNPKKELLQIIDTRLNHEYQITNLQQLDEKLTENGPFEMLLLDIPNQQKAAAQSQSIKPLQEKLTEIEITINKEFTSDEFKDTQNNFMEKITTIKNMLTDLNISQEKIENIKEKIDQLNNDLRKEILSKKVAQIETFASKINDLISKLDKVPTLKAKFEFLAALPDAIKDVIKKVTVESPLSTLDSNFTQDFKKAELKKPDFKAITSDLKSIETKTCSELPEILNSLHATLNHIIEEKQRSKLREILTTTGIKVDKDETTDTIIERLKDLFITTCYLPLYNQFVSTLNDIENNQTNDVSDELKKEIKAIEDKQQESFETLPMPENERAFFVVCTSLLASINTVFRHLTSIKDFKGISLPKIIIDSSRAVNWETFNQIVTAMSTLEKSLNTHRIKSKYLLNKQKLLGLIKMVTHEFETIKEGPEFSQKILHTDLISKLKLIETETKKEPNQEHEKYIQEYERYIQELSNILKDLTYIKEASTTNLNLDNPSDLQSSIEELTTSLNKLIENSKNEDIPKKNQDLLKSIAIKLSNRIKEIYSLYKSNKNDPSIPQKIKAIKATFQFISVLDQHRLEIIDSNMMKGLTFKP